jgi:hypothetical protein
MQITISDAFGIPLSQKRAQKKKSSCRGWPNAARRAYHTNIYNGIAPAAGTSWPKRSAMV